MELPGRGGRSVLSAAGEVVSALSREKERAMTIAYTALWQLRELDPDGEPESFRAARIELRKDLDEAAAKGDAPRPARPTHRPAALAQ
jgi:hypothetical protein